MGPATRVKDPAAAATRSDISGQGNLELPRSGAYERTDQTPNLEYGDR